MKSESSLPHFRDPAILVVIHLILAAVAFQPVPHPGGDSAVYLSVARSILQGTYRDIFDPAQPYHMVYPPGFPLIIAAGLLAGLKPWIGLKLVIVAFSAAMVLFTWIYARREGRMIAVVAAGALAISPGVISLSHWELSDVPFTAFAIASLIMWRRSETGTTRTLAFATILTLATYSVRSAGIALIVAAAMWLAVRKRWRDLGIFAAIIVPPATAWSVFTRGQAGYFDQLFIADAYSQRREIGIGDLAARFAENIEAYASEYLPVLVTGESPSWMLVPVVILLLLAMYGWLSRIRSSQRAVLEFFVPLYAGMILLWLPQFSGERLILPLYPFILIYAALGLVRGTAAVPVAVRRAAYVLAPSAFLLAAMPGTQVNTESGLRCRKLYAAGNRYPCVTQGWEDFFRAAELSATLLPENSVVLSRKPAFLFTLSGHRGRLYPYSRSPAVLIDSARAIGARHVIIDHIDELAPRYLIPAIVQRPNAFCVVHTFGSGRGAIFGIVPGAERIADAQADPGGGYHEIIFRTCTPDTFARH